MNISKKKIVNAGIAVLFIVASLFIIKSWKNDDYLSNTAGKHQFVDERAGKKSAAHDLSLKKNSQAAVLDNQGAEETDIDPRLKNVTIKEFPVENEIEEEIPPEETERRRIIGILKQPFPSINKKLSSFIYKGEMRMTIPTFNRDEESYKNGKRFGKSENVVSSFVYKKDEHGNYSLYQKTESTSNSQKYKEKHLNGEFFCVDGEYYFTDLSGQRASDEEIQKIISNNDKNKSEPLVANNWRQLVKSFDGVLGFDDSENTSESTYDLKGINRELQEKTTLLKEIVGGISIDESLGTMTEGSIEGSAVLKDGYMSGAEIGFSISLKVSDVGLVGTIKKP